MPEELVIVLVVIVAILWAALALFGAVSKGVQESFKELNENLAKRRIQRFQQKKAGLVHFVKAIRPNDLSRAERTINRLEAEFRRIQTETVWIANRPTWEKKPFQRQLYSHQNALRAELNVAEIDAILCPDQVPWFEEEHLILTQNCTYPPSAPTNTSREFHEHTLPSLDLGEAIFEVDRTAVRVRTLGVPSPLTNSAGF